MGSSLLLTLSPQIAPVRSPGPTGQALIIKTIDQNSEVRGQECWNAMIKGNGDFK